MDYLKGDLITYIDCLIRKSEVIDVNGTLELNELKEESAHYSVCSKLKPKAINMMIKKLKEIK